MAGYVLIAGLVAAPAGLALLRFGRLKLESSASAAAPAPHGHVDGGMARRIDAPRPARKTAVSADGGAFTSRVALRGGGA